MLMKKFFTSFILALGGLILGASQAWAYSLFVGGKKFTGSTLSTGGSFKSGTITYNESTKVLTLKDAVINCDDTSSGIYNEDIDGLVIYLEGDCSITTKGNGIKLEKSTRLSSTTGGTLNIDITGGTASDNYCCIWMRNGEKLSVEWLHINYKGLNYGICGTASSPKETFSALCCELKGSVTGSNACVSHFATVGTNANFWQDGLTYSNNQLRKGSNVAKTANLVANLKVGRNIVNTGNSYTASGSGKGFSAGSVSYDYSNKTLTLSNATFTATGKDIFTGFPNSAIENFGVEGLKIKVVGTNTFSSASGDLTTGIHSRERHKSFDAAFTIEGDSYTDSKLTLNLSGTRSHGILTDGSLTVNNVDMTINCSTNSNNQGINGGDLGKADLSLTKSKVTVNASASGKAIVNFNSAAFSNCDVKTDGVYFFTAHRAFTDKSGNVAKSVEIDIPSGYYNWQIFGRRVNTLNRTNVVVDGQTAGKISFDSGVLTVDGVKLTAPSGNKNVALELLGNIAYGVKLVGNSEITTNGSVCRFGGSVSFTGSGNLRGTSTEEHGISTSGGAGVNIETTGYFIIQAAKYGYYGDGTTYNDALTLKKSSSDTNGYTFQGKQGAIYNVRNLVLNNMDFINNNSTFNLGGCYFYDKFVRQNGGAIAKGDRRVGFHSIQEKLGFSIGGKEINRVYGTEKIYIGSPYITAGGSEAVVYDPTTKKLTLTNATINTGSEDLTAISNTGFNGLTISVKGANMLKTSKSGYGAFFISNKTTISSETNDFKSSLTCDAGGSVGMGVYFNGSAPVLTVQDKAVLNASGSFIGIGGNNGGNFGETLNVNNATVNVTDGGIWGLKNFSMSNCKITIPSGGYFNADAHCIVASGSTAAKKVLILSVNDKITAIDAVQVNNDAEVRAIYDAGGRHIEGARSGLNIVRMKDGTVRKVMVK